MWKIRVRGELCYQMWAPVGTCRCIRLHPLISDAWTAFPMALYHCMSVSHELATLLHFIINYIHHEGRKKKYTTCTTYNIGNTNNNNNDDDNDFVCLATTAYKSSNLDGTDTSHPSPEVYAPALDGTDIPPVAWGLHSCHALLSAVFCKIHWQDDKWH